MRPSTHPSHKGLTLEQISPHEWPVKPGQVTILLSNKVGYCAVVQKTSSELAWVSLLDAHIDDPLIKVPLYDCVPTGKRPLDLVSMYEQSPQEFSHALGIERSFPDFDSPVLKKSKRGSGAKGTKKAKKKPLEGAALVAALANLDESQKKALGVLFKKIKGD